MRNFAIAVRPRIVALVSFSSRNRATRPKYKKWTSMIGLKHSLNYENNSPTRCPIYWHLVRRCGSFVITDWWLKFNVVCSPAGAINVPANPSTGCERPLQRGEMKERKGAQGTGKTHQNKFLITA